MEPQTGDNLSFEDAALVRQVQQGEMRAFEQLVVKYQGRIYNLCLRMVSHAESARDLTQDTFLKALQAIQRFEHKSSFFTWLFRIAMNLSITYRRRSKRIRMQSLDAGDSSAESGGEQAGRLQTLVAEQNMLAPPDEMKRAELHRQVMAALEELDEDYKAVVVLRDIEDMDYESIAAVLEIPIGTVRSRLHRGRLALLERLKPAMEKAG
ncbi:MAG: ECF RNA polymerase sigma-E factor [Phycisphaerae bacterium]|nr:ECF RNA polymerase sigma-E factor [Phycisphaerae bacterium]